MAFLNGAFVLKFPMFCGLVKFKLIWFPGGLACSLVKVYILLSFSCLPRNLLPFWSLMAYALFQHMNHRCVSEKWSCSHNFKIFLGKYNFCVWMSGTSYAYHERWKDRYRYDIVKSETLISLSMNPFAVSTVSIHLVLPECGRLSPGVCHQ